MARVNAQDVLTILPTTTMLCDSDIDSLILAAACLVDDIAENCGSNLSDECLKQIEAYLTAHFAATKDFTLNIKSEKDACSGASATYGWTLGDGILGTPFGQMANTLSKGCLVSLDATHVGFYAIGCH